MRAAALSPAGRRGVGLVAAPLVVVAVSTLLLPGQGGGHGTPSAVLFGGLVVGAVNALMAGSLVLLYRSQRIINFAQTAIGFAGARLAFDCILYTDVPFPIVLLLSVALAAGAGVLFDMALVRRFARSHRIMLTVVTIAGAEFMTGPTITEPIEKLPFFPPFDSALRRVAQTTPFADHLPLAGYRFFVGSLKVPFGSAHLFALEAAALGLLALGLFLRYTRLGIGVRALAENAERTSLLGISTGFLSSVAWGLAGALSGLSLMATGFLSAPDRVNGLSPEVLLPAIAGAVVGGMRSIPVAVVACVVIGMARGALLWSFNDSGPLLDVGLLVVICVALLAMRGRQARSDREEAGSWASAEEPRPVPRELASLPLVRNTRLALGAVAVAAALLFPFLFATRFTSLGGAIALHAVIGLSVVLLTGWGGQVSVAQLAFAAIGAVGGSWLTATAGVPFWVAVPLAAVLAGAVAFVVGLPALRIRGLLLVATSFAFAVAVPAVLFHAPLSHVLPDSVERPTLFLLRFEDERSMYFLCLGFLVLCLALMRELRRSRFGRLLIAIRENEADVEAQGVDVVRMKLLGFAVAGAIAGAAGAVLAHHQRGLSVESFGADAGIELFLYAVVGGIASPGGAVAGILLHDLIAYFVSSPILRHLMGPGFTIYILYAAPAGLASVAMRMRDGALRIVALRSRLMVPSLFVGAEADALQAGVLPLAEPMFDRGLGRVPEAEDLVLSSVVVPRPPVVGGHKPDDDERAVLATAAGASRHEEPTS